MQCAWNGHYGCTCYHPLFLFNQFGDLERCALRPGNVHTADGWQNVLTPVVERYKGKVSRIYFRADAGFANPDVYEFLEAERVKYAIRLPANRVLQEKIGYLLARPVGRPPIEVRRYYANFTYQAGSWSQPRRVVAKVEWHPGELYPRVGFIVTNMSRPAKNVVAFYNKRGTCEQWIKEGKGAIKWTRLSCRSLAANAVRLQLHALAYNLGNFPDYREWCKERGNEPEKPYSGTLSLRIAPELHRRVAEQAAKAGESINQIIAERLEEVA